MFIKVKVHLKMIYESVSSLYRKKKESLDSLNEENTFSPLPGYIERVDCEKGIGLYLTLKEVKQIPTSMAIIHYGHKGSYIIPAKPNSQTIQQ